MRKQLLLVALLCTAFGASIGYFAALGSSFKKTMDTTSALPDAVTKMGEFSDLDMAIIIRMFSASIAGGRPHDDEAVTRHLAKYYHQRSSLSDAEQEALGATVLLPAIEELRNSSKGLNISIDTVQNAEEEK